MAGGIVSRLAQHDRPPVDFMAVAKQAINRIEHALPNENSQPILFVGYGAQGLLAARVGDRTKAESALKQAIDIEACIDIEASTEKQVTARGLLLAELDLIREGRLESAEERSMARQLADTLGPDLCAVAA
jgi:hypothetical protein